ncbi:MAG: iron donor protein CyaY [Burkholderiales bacterium]|nr:iron donor protein CyaY [Burkholderiales bacterium]
MSAPAESLLSDAEYRRLSHELLSLVERQVDAWLDEDLIDIDTHRSGGLIELTFPNGSKIILNTQPPLHEVWMAARGGGYHFRWDGQAWRDTRDMVEFLQRLSGEASAQAGLALNFQRG